MILLKKVIITNELIIPHYTEEGIFIISLKDFLLEKETIKNIFD